MVIYDYLIWGMLICVSDDKDFLLLLKDLLYRMHELGLSVRFDPITAEAYSEWVQGKGKDCYIVMLLVCIVIVE